MTDEIIIDNFAGGGGASTGIEQALNRPVDEAINHDGTACALHAANHPRTRHHCEDVFKVNIDEVTQGRPVGLGWFSPDCKDFSKAKGGRPKSKKIRGLAWVVVKWAAHPTAAPRVIVLENVEEFQDWGPLLADGRRCPDRRGRTFKHWVKQLRNLGYEVEWKELRACDYGAPTIRKRLYLIARRDGRPIVWPAPTHADPKSPGFAAGGLLPWRTAAESLDWSLPCPSIFLTRREAKKLGVKRPLAKATMRRLARGVFKFVINAQEPFLVSLTHQGGDRVEPVTEPIKTITGAHRGEKALVVPFVTDTVNASTQRNFAANEGLRTQCAEVKGGHFALVAAFLAKHYGGVVGSPVDKSIGTVTSVDHHSLVASHLTKFYGTTTGHPTGTPLHSITSDGNHIGEVRAFLMKYYGTAVGVDPRGPMHTIPTVDRFGLVVIHGETFCISDIGLRMLAARELYRCQGFPESYIIDIEIEAVRHGKLKRVKLSGEAKVRMCGNSVCPPVARAIVAANVPYLRRGE